ncbi:MAG: polymerase, partial [Microbacteriaceae bacterium]|nr:polymerase [Microbacteriaceae bacterium]
GAKTEESLQKHGLRTIGDLATTPVDVLRSMIGEAAGSKLHDLAWGIDPRPVQPRAVEKSIGHEVTFETDVTDPTIIRRELLRLSSMVAVRLRGGGAVGRTVVLKLRFGDFTTITRSRTLSEPTDLGRRVYDEVCAVYEGVGKQHARVRLVGVRVEQLSETGGGPTSLWDDDDGWREAEDVMDAVSARFGRGSVTQASLLGNNRGRESEAKGFARDS